MKPLRFSKYGPPSVTVILDDNCLRVEQGATPLPPLREITRFSGTRLGRLTDRMFPASPPWLARARLHQSTNGPNWQRRPQTSL